MGQSIRTKIKQTVCGWRGHQPNGGVVYKTFTTSRYTDMKLAIFCNRCDKYIGDTWRFHDLRTGGMFYEE